MRYESVDAFLQELPGLAAGSREKLRGQNGLFALESKQGRQFWVRLDDGVVTLPETAPEEKPDCTVIADESDVLALINREISPVVALLFGKVQVKGDKSILLKLAALA